jgi:hypothetical protein
MLSMRAVRYVITDLQYYRPSIYSCVRITFDHRAVTLSWQPSSLGTLQQRGETENYHRIWPINTQVSTLIVGDPGLWLVILVLYYYSNVVTFISEIKCKAQ